MRRQKYIANYLEGYRKNTDETIEGQRKETIEEEEKED